MSTLCFFPWLTIKEKKKVGRFSLIPFDLSSTGAEADHIRPILEPFKASTEKPIRRTTLIQLEGKTLYEALSEDEKSSVAQFGELFALAALARRRFFAHSGYLNRDTFGLVIQDFTDGKGAALTTRRRDGSTLGYYTADVYKVRVPFHVSIEDGYEIDEALLTSLDKMSDADKWKKYEEAITSFLRANTDDRQVTEPSEAVLMIGAFERLLNCNHGNGRELVERFLVAFDKIHKATELKDCERLEEMKKRFPKANSLREIWLQDFFVSRGDLGHGRTKASYKGAWNITEHLLLGAYIFPKLLMAELHNDGFYKLTEKDITEMAAFDNLLCLKEPMAIKNRHTENEKCCWNSALYDAHWDYVRGRAIATFEAESKKSV